jgi:hypothetical protein
MFVLYEVEFNNVYSFHFGSLYDQCVVHPYPESHGTLPTGGGEEGREEKGGKYCRGRVVCF